MLSNEAKAAIIGAFVGSIISGGVSVWATYKVDSIESLNRSHQERLEARNIESNLGASRANHLISISTEILGKYGDVTAVINMSHGEWYKLNSYINSLQVIGAIKSAESLRYFYKNTNRSNLNNGESGREKYYTDMKNLTAAIQGDIDAYFSATPIEMPNN